MKKKLFSVTSDDLEWSYFVGPGKGGQAKQKTSSGASCFHPPSGASGRCSESRSQLENKRIAFRRMANSMEMRRWIDKRIREISDGETTEQWVEEQTKPQNLKIETKEGGKWVENNNLLD